MLANPDNNIDGPDFTGKLGLRRYWWRMLGMKCVVDNFKMLVTFLAILVTNVHYLFTLATDTNIQTMSPRSEFFHQHPKTVANVKSQHHDVINIKRWFDKNESFLSEKFSLKVRMMPEGFSSPHRANRTSEPPREKYIFNMITHWFHESKIYNVRNLMASKLQDFLKIREYRLSKYVIICFIFLICSYRKDLNRSNFKFVVRISD